MDSRNWKWSANAERALQVAVMRFGKKNWAQVGNFLDCNGETCKRCWERVMDPKLKVTLKMNDIKYSETSSNAEQEQNNESNCNTLLVTVDETVNNSMMEIDIEDTAVSGIHAKQTAVCEEVTEKETQCMDIDQDVEENKLKSVNFDVRHERQQRVEHILKELQRNANYQEAESIRHFQAILKIRRLHLQRMMKCSHLSNEALKRRVSVSERKIKCEAEQLLFGWTKSCKLDFQPKSMTNSTFQDVVKLFCAKSFPLSLKFN